jgi:hypothetical protein
MIDCSLDENLEKKFPPELMRIPDWRVRGWTHKIPLNPAILTAWT